MKKAEIVKNISGKEIHIEKFALYDSGVCLCIELCFLLNDQTCKLLFENISNVKIDNIGPNMHIYGFQIVDNTEKGWQKDKRYKINDYEDGNLSFYCENIEII